VITPATIPSPLFEYSIRLVVRARRRGFDSPLHRRKILKALNRKLGNGYTVELCEVREAHYVPDIYPKP
jgi:hypothetical protein